MRPAPGRPSSCFASVRARSISAGSWPSQDSVRQPDAANRASWSVESDSDTAPSMVMSLSSHRTISRPSFRWPASAMASWLMPSIRQPSPAMTQVRWSHRVRPELGAHLGLGHGEADRGRQPLTQRAGRRLDPLGVAVFGMARRDRAPLAEVADLVQRHLLEPGQVQQRVKQHRPMPGRQDEAVAVEPVRARPRRISGACPTEPSPRPPCPSASPDVPNSPLRPHPSPARGSRLQGSSGRGRPGGVRSDPWRGSLCAGAGCGVGP